MRAHLLLLATICAAACSSSDPTPDRGLDSRVPDKSSIDVQLDARADAARPDLAPLPPDGPPPPKLQKVIFTRRIASGNHDLYVANEDGTAVTPLATTSFDERLAQVVPDGRVFYTRYTTYENLDIYKVKIDGTGTTPLLATEKPELFIQYSPDDDRVIYWNWDGGAGACAKYDIMSMMSDGTSIVTLAATRQTNYFKALSHGRVVYHATDASCANPDIMSVRTDGNDTQTLAGSAGADQLAAVTPTGKALLYLAQGDLRAVGVDGNGQVTIGTPGSNIYFASTTDDDRVLYIVAKTGDASSGLYVIDVATGMGQKGLAPKMTIGVVRHRNGEVAFAAGDYTTSNPMNLYRVRLDGTGLALLASGDAKTSYEPIGFTNGRVIYRKIKADQNNDADLYSVKFDGTGTVALTATPDYEDVAAITPNDKIVFSRIVKNGSWDVYIVNDDGTAGVALAATSDNEFYRGLTKLGRVLIQLRGEFTGGTMNDNAELISIKTDGTGKVVIGSTAQDEFFAAVY